MKYLVIGIIIISIAAFGVSNLVKFGKAVAHDVAGDFQTLIVESQGK